MTTLKILTAAAALLTLAGTAQAECNQQDFVALRACQAEAALGPPTRPPATTAQAKCNQQDFVALKACQAEAALGPASTGPTNSMAMMKCVTQAGIDYIRQGGDLQAIMQFDPNTITEDSPGFKFINEVAKSCNIGGTHNVGVEMIALRSIALEQVNWRHHEKITPPCYQIISDDWDRQRRVCPEPYWVPLR